MSKDVFNNFKEMPWFDSNYEIIILGSGGIGSWTTLSLARQGYEIHLFDHDHYEAHNLGNQLASLKDVGRSKTEVTKELCKQYADNKNIHTYGKYDEDSITSNIVISCLDNIPTRRLAFNKWLEYQSNKTERKENEVNVFLDGRMGAEIGQVFCVNSKLTAQAYEQTLWDDSNAEPEPCSARATTQTGLIISGLITSILLNQITNKKLGFEMREVPFLTTFELPLLSFELCSATKYLTKTTT